jgi:FecR protein
MMPPKRCIATRVCAFLALFLAGRAVADPIGVITDLTGPLLAKTASGSIKVLAVGSSVELSDTLVSRASAYARLALTDHTTVELGPATELVLDKYSFHEKTSPTRENGSQFDEAVLILSRGSVRVTSGVLGTRDKDSFALRAGTAVIDIGHSTFIAEYRQPAPGELARDDSFSAPTRRAPILGVGHARGTYTYVQLQSFDSVRLAQNIPGPSPGLSPGLYVQVLDGLIHLTNAGGTQSFTAGQFGFTPSFQQPPVVLPVNPGMQFTPPPVFSQASGSTAGSGSSGGSKSGTVDCIVR